MKRSISDVPVGEVAAYYLAQDPNGARTSGVIRETFDQLYDGQRTGRYSFDQLLKTEKTYFGTIFEIKLQRELQFPGGSKLDFLIVGHEVDCKYSNQGARMLPPECFGELCLVAQANDQESKWSLGLVRISEANRRASVNRDMKTGLNKHGRDQIFWLFKDQALQPNALLQLPRETVNRIMSHRSGQARVNDLMRTATNMRLSRNIIATVAQQDDFMKRVRSNGGARTALQPEGIMILGGDYRNQRNIASALGAAVPLPGELVSVRVTPAPPRQGAEIAGGWWRLTTPDEWSQSPAPIVS